MAQTYSIAVDHELYYNNKEPVPIPELIASLQGIESLVKRTPAMLEDMLPGVKIKDVNVYVNELYSGSLREDLIIDFVFGGQEEYDRFREAVRKFRKGGFSDMTGDDRKALKPLMGLLFAGMIGAGVMYITKDSGEPTTHIEAYNNTIINFGAGEFDIKSDEFKAIIESATTTNKKKLVKDVVKIIKPAKLDPDASLQIDGNSSLTIAPEIIKHVPEEYEAPKPKEKTKNLSNATVMIFASDRDRLSQGWAGTIPGTVDKRTKVTLDESIIPKKLHGKLQIKADVTIYSKYKKAIKDYEAIEIFIKKTY